MADGDKATVDAMAAWLRLQGFNTNGKRESAAADLLEAVFARAERAERRLELARNALIHVKDDNQKAFIALHNTVTAAHIGLSGTEDDASPTIAAPKAIGPGARLTLSAPAVDLLRALFRHGPLQWDMNRWGSTAEILDADLAFDADGWLALTLDGVLVCLARNIHQGG